MLSEVAEGCPDFSPQMSFMLGGSVLCPGVAPEYKNLALPEVI